MVNPPIAIQQIKPNRPRWVLHVQATFWRVLMALGMFIHRLAPPRPTKPAFTKHIQSTVSGKQGTIPLQFYVPRDYETQKTLWKSRSGSDEEQGSDEVALEDIESRTDKGKNRRVSTISAVSQQLKKRGVSTRRWSNYPVVINFHGGGFTLGTAKDDARWCNTVVEECQAVVVSVDYRLAPECPFPTAVEDGVDAVLWVYRHAKELGIDRDNIAISGFSSGGNMAFSVPLRLYDEQTGFDRSEASDASDVRLQDGHEPRGEVSILDSAASSDTQVAGNAEGSVSASKGQDTTQPAHAGKDGAKATAQGIPFVPIRCIVSWYPSLDYTRTREQRRATSKRKDQELSAIFTDLFDESYLHPPDTISLDSPYLSPGVAPTALLKNALPQEIILHTCEWDMLLDEGLMFKDRLESTELGKKVTFCMVKEVPHGWDKAPNPLKPTPGVREHYLHACKELRRVFAPRSGYMPREHPTAEGMSAAPRGSESVVR